MLWCPGELPLVHTKGVRIPFQSLLRLKPVSNLAGMEDAVSLFILRKHSY